jgi:hypothetical protein
MILKRRAALDGVQLDQVDSRILIQGIETQAAREQYSTLSLGDGKGSRITGKKRDWLDVIIRFTINEKSYHPEERAEVLEAVNSWAAKGGWLTVNYKPDRRLRVFLAQAAAEGDAASRGTYTLTLRACGVPWWTQENATMLYRQNVNSVQLTMANSGNAESEIEFAFHNNSGETVNSVSVNTGESVMTFSGLALANGETLTVTHEDTGKADVDVMEITGSGTRRSARIKRTAASNTRLTVSPGTHTVTFTADKKGNLTIFCAGRWV